MGQRRGRQSRNFDISQLGAKAQEQIRQHLGDDKPFQRLLGQKPQKVGRYQVSPELERTVDDIVFDSKWEATVYIQLRNVFGRQRLQLQPRFLLQEPFALGGDPPLKFKAIHYVADFLIGPLRSQDDAPLEAGHFVIDAKGHPDATYKLKRKVFAYRYRKPIIEIKTPKELQELIERVLRQHQNQ